MFETVLRDMCLDHKLFPHSFTILRSDMVGNSILGVVMF